VTDESDDETTENLKNQIKDKDEELARSVDKVQSLVHQNTIQAAIQESMQTLIARTEEILDKTGSSEAQTVGLEQRIIESQQPRLVQSKDYCGHGLTSQATKDHGAFGDRHSSGWISSPRAQGSQGNKHKDGFQVSAPSSRFYEYQITNKTGKHYREAGSNSYSAVEGAQHYFSAR
jgi:C1A family cysteine protease